MTEDSVDIEALERLAGHIKRNTKARVTMPWSTLDEAADAILSLIRRVREAEATTQAWIAECARVRDAVTKADEEITEPMDAAEIVVWLKSHRFTHSDWGSWFEANPDDARQKVNGNAEFHRKVESRYTAMIAGVEALQGLLREARGFVEEDRQVWLESCARWVRDDDDKLFPDPATLDDDEKVHLANYDALLSRIHTALGGDNG